MSWDGDIRKQVLEAFRDAQRRPWELEPDEREGPTLCDASIVVEKPDTAARSRRIVARTA